MEQEEITETLATTNEDEVEAPAEKTVSQRAALLIDFIERARWNIEVCEANDRHHAVRLEYAKIYGESTEATEEDKKMLADIVEDIEKSKKDRAEQERFLAFCVEALDKQQALDEAAS